MLHQSRFDIDERYCLYSRLRARSPYAAMDDMIAAFGPDAVRFELLYKSNIARQMREIFAPHPDL